MEPLAKRLEQSSARTATEVAAILWSSAVQAFIRAILVLVLGSVAVGLVSGAWGEMTPSLHPGLSGHSPFETHLSGAWKAVGHSLGEHRFLIIFAVLFVLTAWKALFGRSDTKQEGRAPTRMQWIWSQLAENWFDLIVRNAFGALIAAIFVVWAQRFSPMRWLYQALLQPVLDVLQHIAASIFGTSVVEGVQAVFDWYGDNQLRFTFWLFYLAAICDDLGLPNLKTLGRWLERRVRDRVRKPANPG